MKNFLKMIQFEDLSKSKRIDEDYDFIIPEVDGTKKCSVNCRINVRQLLKAGGIRPAMFLHQIVA